MIRRVLLLLILAVVLGGLPGLVSAEEVDPAELAASRDLLLRTAHRALAGQGRGPDPFEPMQRTLANDQKDMMAYAPRDAEEAKLLDEFEKTVAERILLIGWPDSGIPDVPAEGALQESQRLDAWLAGKLPCDVIVRDVDKPDVEPRSYAYPPEPKAEPEAEPEPPPPAEEGLDTPPPSPPPSEADEPAAPPEAPEPPAEKKEGAPAPAEIPSMAAWAKDVVAVGEGGTLRRKRISTEVCGVVSQLLRAAKQKPAYVHPEVRRLRRHATAVEDVFAYNAPYVALRLLQADERNKTLQRDQPPPSLVDQSMIDEKQQWVDLYGTELDLRRAQKQDVIAHLDVIVDDLDRWKTQAALLARQIEKAQDARQAEAKAAEAEGRPPVPPSSTDELELRLARARESLVSLDLTLLYQTALRAEKRLELLTKLERAAEEEKTASEQVKARYSQMLMKLRAARRLDRLYGDQLRLRKWIASLESQELPQGSVFEQRLTSYRALLAVSEITVEAVERRRALAPGGAQESDELEETDLPEVDEQGDSEEKSPLSRVLLQPDKATWDVKYVEIAQRELLDPARQKAFDAKLIAAHYAAVDDRIRALEKAHRTNEEEQDLKRRFDEAFAAAVAALEPLRSDEHTVVGRRLPDLLEEAAEDFNAAMDGIVEQSVHNRERLLALLDYRDLLLDQGTRSLLIRTDRDLADRDIRRAIRDARGAVNTAARWVTMRDEQHAVGFLQSSWLRLLLVLALVVAAVWGVKYTRRRLDLWIERRVAANRVLRRAGASLREEQDEAKRRREEEDQAKPAVTVEEILQQVVEEPVEPPPEDDEDDPDEDAKGGGR